MEGEIDLKVLHLISGGDTGGAKTHIISLLKGLNKRIDARIICFIEDTFYEDVLAAGIPIKVFKQKSRSDMSVINRLTDEINQEGYDIIHCHGARANFIAQFLKGKLDKPFITTIHSDYKLDFKDNFYKRLVYTSLNTISLRRFDFFVAVSDSFKEMLIERGFKRDRIFVTYNGIDMGIPEDHVSKDEFLGRYGIEDKGFPIVGILARLDKVKDHRTFIEAARQVLKTTEVDFLIAGEGAEEASLKELVKDYGLESRVHFIGFVKDPYSFFNAIDVNVLTSVSESFPYVILEGARMKKPVVSTKVGGIARLVDDGENGYLCQTGDWKAIGDRILSLVKDGALAKFFGQKLYKAAEDRFSYDSMAESHIATYSQILSKGPKIVMSGYFGFDNSGDDAILKAIVKDLREQDPSVRIKVLSKDPSKTEQLCPVTSANRFKLREVISSLRDAQLVISGGGSLLQDVTSTRSLLYYLALMKLAFILKKPVMIYANGIGPINKTFNRRLTKWILERVDLITLRDKGSLDFVKSIGVKNDRIMVTADPVFTLNPAERERIKEILRIEGIDTSRQLIGISVRNWKNDDALIQAVAKGTRRLIDDKSVGVVMIPMHYPEDLAISERISDLSGSNNCWTLKGKYSVEEIMGIIREMEIMAAMRLHSLIYAATQGVPMAGLVYDPKVKGFLDELGLDHYTDVKSITSESFYKLVSEVWAVREEVGRSIDIHKERLEKLALENIRQAYSLIGR